MSWKQPRHVLPTKEPATELRTSLHARLLPRLFLMLGLSVLVLWLHGSALQPLSMAQTGGLVPSVSTIVLGGGEESATVVNPTNASNLVTFATARPPRYSLDGGATWTTSSSSPFTQGSDPYAAFDGSGFAYISRFRTTGGNIDGVAIARSTDGGATFTQVGDAMNPNTDFTFSDGTIRKLCQLPASLLVDFPKIEGRGSNLYSVAKAWFQASGASTSCDMITRAITRSTDGGITWGSGKTISSNEISKIGIGADDTVYLVSAGCAAGPGISLVSVNPANWNDPFPLEQCITAGGIGTSIPAERPVIASHPTDPNRLYIVFQDGIAGIFVTASTNHGSTWSAPVRASDLVVPATFRGRPYASVSANGRLDVAWHDYRNTIWPAEVDAYYTYSLDGGATFAANLRLSASASPLGEVNDYLSIASSGANAYVTHSSADALYFSKIVFVTSSAGAPGIPTGLAAVAGPGRITLTWAAPASNGGSPLSNYRIYRGTSSGGETLYATIPLVTTWTDPATTPGSTYYYKVTALNAAAEGASSTEVSRAPAAAAVPAAPTVPYDVAYPSQVSIFWTVPVLTGGAPITEYRLYRGTSPGGATLLRSLPATATQTSDCCNPPTDGVRYYYQVSAVNVVGEGLRSLEVSAEPPGGMAGPPQGVVASPGNGANNVTWQPPVYDGGSTIIGYRIIRFVEGQYVETNFVVGEIPPTTLAFSDTSATNGVHYGYFVVAHINGSYGQYSVETYVTTGAPVPPSSISASPGDGSATLSWSASDGNGAAVTSYMVYRRVGGGAFQLLTTGGCSGLGAVLSCTDSGLTNGQSYGYKVSGVSSRGEGPLSAEIAVIPAQILTAVSNTNPGGWTSPTSAYASDDVWATRNQANKIVRLGLSNPTASGAVTSVVVRAEVSILDTTPPPNDGFKLAACILATCGTESAVLAGASSDVTISFDVTGLRPGGGAWTWTELNDLEIQVRSSAVGGPDGTWRIDRVWAEVR